MSEIPDSIMKAAREAISPWTIDDGTTAQFEACALSVARAIYAEPLRCKAIWRGDGNILREGSEVVILAFDPLDPNVPARMACWVRHWPEQRDFPVYRSCDLSDLEVSDEDFERMQEAR